jgi:hypothetical protein
MEWGGTGENVCSRFCVNSMRCTLLDEQKFRTIISVASFLALIYSSLRFQSVIVSRISSLSLMSLSCFVTYNSFILLLVALLPCLNIIYYLFTFCNPLTLRLCLPVVIGARVALTIVLQPSCEHLYMGCITDLV